MKGLTRRQLLAASLAARRGVVFAEDFDSGTLADLAGRWDHINNKGGKCLRFSSETPDGTGRSLEMTATRGQNEGGHLFRLLQPGYDCLFLRFYTRFAEENGFHHHFVSLGGEIDPLPYPVGRAGLRPENRFGTGIEPFAKRSFAPPGAWHFYTYWPEMRSWQSPEGAGTSFYGNNFEPTIPIAVPRGKWISVEIMVKLNTAPEAYDGEQALWIDGRQVARYGPGTPVGRWNRDSFVPDEAGAGFEGFRWRTDMRLKINKLWLSHYVSETAFARSEKQGIHTPANTVWFDHVVVSTSYIGPLGQTA